MPTLARKAARRGGMRLICVDGARLTRFRFKIDCGALRTRKARHRPRRWLMIPHFAGQAGFPGWRRLVCVEGARFARLCGCIEDGADGARHTRRGALGGLVMAGRARSAGGSRQVGLERVGGA
eukprot:5273522-Prymnesium_polylepis.1